MSTPSTTVPEPAALLQAARSALTNAYLSMTDIARAGADKASAATAAARDGVQHARDRSVEHVRVHPVQSVLIAVAVGAVIGALADWFTTRRYR